VTVVATGLTGADDRSDQCRRFDWCVCVCVTGLISVGLAASYVGFPLQFVCGCFGGNCGLFLGSVTLYWLRSLGKFEEFEVEVILGCRPSSSH
jgi:tellurite resistance protein TehA-like permease